jgi:hypothetical protein
MNVEAMKQVLDALEIGYKSVNDEAVETYAYVGYKTAIYEDVKQIADAITTLRAAIEQAEKQNPGQVEFDYRHPRAQALIANDAQNRMCIDLIWRILEDPYRDFTASDMEHWDEIHDAVRAAVTKQAEKQDPVEQDAKQWGNRLNDASWAATHAWNRDLMGPMSGAIFNNIKGVIRVAILKYLEGYTTPPAAQRQWVGLTDEERLACEQSAKGNYVELVRAIEAKLKEKNT